MPTTSIFQSKSIRSSTRRNQSTRTSSFLTRESTAASITYVLMNACRSKEMGRFLVLGDAIQCCEKDEFAYQEMMAFLPLNVHPAPKKVLIIGGGDGGVAREVLKHPLVDSVVLCEIDEAVVRVSKQFLPFMSSSFSDPRLEVKIEDGLKFVKNTDEKFDVIITDSSDPTGPAVGLFNREYYESLYNALESGGVICSQAEDFWFDLKIVKSLHAMCKEIFISVAYASVLVPTYPSGQIGCVLASKHLFRDFAKAIIPHDRQFLSSLRYYNEKVHEAAFALPNFVVQVSTLVLAFLAFIILLFSTWMLKISLEVCDIIKQLWEQTLNQETYIK